MGLSDASPDRFARRRALMVRTQLQPRGITDPRVLAAMAEVPRERFVGDDMREAVYEDCALSIEAGQTISQPYMVALMTQELRLAGGERVLEIGTGSGYQTAVLARLCRHVVTVERHAELSARAQRVLAELGVANVSFHVGDGTLGRPSEGPFDRIIVTAGGPGFPEPLVEQLAVGGRLLAPVGSRRRQMLTALEKLPDGRTREIEVCPCVFVGLIGEFGLTEE